MQRPARLPTAPPSAWAHDVVLGTGLAATQNVPPPSDPHTKSGEAMRAHTMAGLAAGLLLVAGNAAASDRAGKPAGREAIQAQISVNAPKARFYFAALGGWSTPNTDDTKVTIQRPDALKNQALRVVIRNLGDGTTQTKDVAADRDPIVAWIAPWGPCPDGQKYGDGGPSRARVRKTRIYEVDVYLASQVPNPASPPASPTPHARIVGGSPGGTHGPGVRTFDPGTPDNGVAFATALAGATNGTECRPGPEPWPEPEPSGDQLK